ncbi:AmmeMemoRadiSam system protein A [Limisalsivibrio acetivorans]|uniref:AmmeMemoRadiSam system protein A n=1 Tax=Limisalsivibrio acetivorans TaxID=1304888 RepID=UPI0003B5CE6A|nr:AmmeMemoRadiSam system protein A [Limisalsivibrio acetivorans]
MKFTLSDESRKVLLKTAREAVSAELEDRKPEYPEVPEELGFNSGCFVTLHRDGRLRGCIGNFRDDIKIDQNVKEMAYQAAFSDPRFPSLEADALPFIDFEISVLSPMMPLNSVEDIHVGRDGLYVVKGHSRGVLLPQVAIEQGWDAETFLSQTCVKAGLSPDTWRNETIELFRFEAVVFGEND